MASSPVRRHDGAIVRGEQLKRVRLEVLVRDPRPRSGDLLPNGYPVQACSQIVCLHRPNDAHLLDLEPERHGDCGVRRLVQAQRAERFRFERHAPTRFDRGVVRFHCERAWRASRAIRTLLAATSSLTLPGRRDGRATNEPAHRGSQPRLRRHPGAVALRTGSPSFSLARHLTTTSSPADCLILVRADVAPATLTSRPCRPDSTLSTARICPPRRGERYED